MESTEIVKRSNGAPAAGQTVRQGFGERSLAVAAETAAGAVAAQAVAATQARYIMALQRPRDWENVRVKLLAECKRPGFAEVARYKKPIGAGIFGPSIRFAEAAMRAMTNILPETLVTFDSETKRITRVSVTDLEANLTYSKDVVIEKVVERSKSDDRVVISERRNSVGKISYTVIATDDELLNKQNALESKALRVLALRLLPGDILDECMALVQRTKADATAKDPAAAKRRMIDAFAEQGVHPTDLAKYIGHDLEKIVPAELAELRDVYESISDGEATWIDLLEHKLAEKTKEQPGAATTAAPVPNAKPVAAPTPKPVTAPKNETAAALLAAAKPVPEIDAERDAAKARESEERAAALAAQKEADEADRALAAQERAEAVQRQEPVAGETQGNEPTQADVLLQAIFKAETMKDLVPVAARIAGERKAGRITLNEERQLNDEWRTREGDLKKKRTVTP